MLISYFPGFMMEWKKNLAKLTWIWITTFGIRLMISTGFLWKSPHQTGKFCPKTSDYRSDDSKVIAVISVGSGALKSFLGMPI